MQMAEASLRCRKCEEQEEWPGEEYCPDEDGKVWRCRTQREQVHSVTQRRGHSFAKVGPFTGVNAGPCLRGPTQKVELPQEGAKACSVMDSTDAQVCRTTRASSARFTALVWSARSTEVALLVPNPQGKRGPHC